MGNSYSSTRALRVVHLDHTTVRGGAELALVRLLRASENWLPAVVVPAVTDDDVFAALPRRVIRRRTGVRQSPGGSSRSPLRLVGLTLRLIVQAAATRWDPLVRTSDLVAANSTRAATYAALALCGTRRPLVVHLRDLVDVESLGGVGFQIMTRLVLPRADGVIANSATTLTTARPYLRADAKAAVIPSAAGLKSTTPHRLPAERSAPIRIGMLARIDPWKGQAELLEAFAVACPHGVVELEFAGGAPFEHDAFATRLEQRATELGVAGRVRLLGHVDNVQDALRRWDIAVQYSTRAEPLGQNVLQYLAAGLATVVADEGGPREWVVDGENGLRVAPRDPVALGHVLRILIEDSGERQRLAEGAARTRGLLDDDAVARAHGEFYRDVVASRSAQA